jgi:uncharacterized protein YfaS (alpha-2-macroglobulin family)
MDPSWRSALAAAFAAIVTAGALPVEAEPPAARVESFSPRGTAKQVRQVTARFSVPVVALGDPRLADPFRVECSAAGKFRAASERERRPSGKGRWADPRSWVYDFDADLPAGLRCTFTLNDGLTALGRKPIGGERVFSFDTGGPAIVASLPNDGWEEIDEDQVFLVKLDAPAVADAIERHAYCAIDGIVERVPIEVLRGEARSALLAARKQLGYGYFALLWKSGDSSEVRVRDRTLEQAEERVVAVKCRRRLPPATKVRLVWGAGIAAESGIATTADQQLAFAVRRAFLATLECTRTEPRAGCTPIQPITVRFSAPVAREQAMAARLRVAADDARAPDPGELNAKFVESIAFSAPFPEAVTAVLELPAQLADDAGRTLENAARFPLDVRIDEYPPLVKFASEFGILEAREGGVLPVTLRNIDAPAPGAAAAIPGRTLRVGADPAAIADWLRRVRAASARRGSYATDAKTGRPTEWREETGSSSVFAASDATTPVAIPKPEGARPAEVVGIPLGAPGFYVVELESRRLGASLLARDATRYVATSALVTDLAVHLKWGRESSRVWVTRLSDAQPVANARVSVHDYCTGAGLWTGTTGADGVAAIAKSFGEPHGFDGCEEWSPHPLIATAVAPEGVDFGMAVSSWDKGIDPYSFGLETGSEQRAGIVHTVLDRPLFRAGEIVSMKHFLRRHVSEGVAVPDSASGKHKVEIAHVGSDQRYAFEIAFGADGVAEQRFSIPVEAKLGDYWIAIDDRQSARFKVEEFRLPTMRASVSGSARPLVRPSDATLDLHVSYVSGGGASALPVRLRTVVEPWRLPRPGFEDFEFGGEPVSEGLSVREGSYWDVDFSAGTAQETAKARVVPLSLDAEGAARVTVPDLPEVDQPATLVAELEYPDPNGELLTATGRVRLVPAELAVGIRREGWAASSEQMRFRVVVLDLDGKPVARQRVATTLYHAQRYSYRKRLLGGFYTYESAQENQKLDASCSGRTDAQGLLVCELAPGVSGEVLVRAEARDAGGRLAGATASIWVAGDDDWWFGGTAGDRMDLLPEQPEYETGDVARFQVRMPFRSATALVTVEREGVLRSFVTELSGRKPVVRVPIEPADAPNVFVSVLAVRGRLPAQRSWFDRSKEPREVTALVDMARPAYRLGTAEIRVGWRPHRLDVRVAADRATYAIRETANVDISVAAEDESALAPGAEVAVAAVDEALLELAPNRSWELLEAMMGRRGTEVWTSTAQLQVVGKRHYGRKAVPHGGGGGRERARESFDTLLLWSGRVKLDREGRAQVAIPLNDSLTSFRIVAVAHAGADRYGTGSTSVATRQDLILISGLPPALREGDRFTATFTVRNTSAVALPVEVTATTKPALALPAQRIEIPAGEARDVSWEVAVPVGAESLAWDVSAHSAARALSDRLAVSAVVKPAHPVRTYQATIAQLAAPLSMPVARPKDAVPGRGGIEVTLRARLGDGLDGVREWMSHYTYTCLEQNLSRAVALRDRAEWDAWMARLPAYTDPDGLLKYFPSERLDGEDALTAYVLAIADEAGWPIPDAAQARITKALGDFVAGRITRRSALPTADLTVRKLAAIAALARRGAADPSMLDSLALEPDLWPTSAVIDWLGILRRVEGIPGAETKRAHAEAILRTRLNFQGTTMTFSTERSDALWWLMISTDSNAVRALAELLDRRGWREDVPRLVRGALGRQQRGHWNTTVANAWGVLAIEKFSAAFESAPVTGETSIRYGSERASVPWSGAAVQSERALSWQEGSLPLSIAHRGAGRPWAIVRATAALPLSEPLSTGFAIERTVTPVEQRETGRWSRGDTARVRLEIDAQSDMSWVVVDDPVPGGATVLGSGLGGQSQILTEGEQREGHAWPAFEERRFDAFRAYYRFVPKGRFAVEYTVRFNNPGAFGLPATRVEAMYAPEMQGSLPNAPIVVEAAR